jgi:alkylation response protein AidB-like acyl-CoA dehydrogenase
MTQSTTSPIGCAFFNGPPDQIFTVEQFSADDQLMIRTAEEFSRKEILPVVEQLDRQEEGLMPGLIRRAGDLGLCGVDTGEAYGGLGLGKNLAARILEFMSLNASFSVTFGVTTGIAQVGLSLFGTEDQKQKYLPRLASGEWIGAYALSEPNSGSDALSATTRADLRGDHYVLNGTKMWISNAKWAEFFLTMAKIDGDKFSAFLVERDFPGVSIAREEHKMGLKGSSTARLLLEDAIVPSANLLHEPGLGHQVAFNALNLGRFKLSAMSIGPARHAIELASRYAWERKQFGRPIAEFGLIQQKFTLMATLFFVAESMIYRTGALIDEAFAAHGGTIEGNKRAAEEYSVECSICKVFSTVAEAAIIDEALQVYGGYGFTEEFPIARHYRDARVSRIYEGTNEINRVFIADRVARRIKDGRLEAKPGRDTFISDLAARAFESAPSDQIGIGALSDLLILVYAEQSAVSRARQVGPMANLLADCFMPWANARAAEAFQTITGESVTLPVCNKTAWQEIAYSLR